MLLPTSSSAYAHTRSSVFRRRHLDTAPYVAVLGLWNAAAHATGIAKTYSLPILQRWLGISSSAAHVASDCSQVCETVMSGACLELTGFVVLLLLVWKAEME